jgi:hypothetical protein
MESEVYVLIAFKDGAFTLVPYTNFKPHHYQEGSRFFMVKRSVTIYLLSDFLAKNLSSEYFVEIFG